MTHYKYTYTEKFIFVGENGLIVRWMHELLSVHLLTKSKK